ncbi:MAG: NUDIX hydrolase [Betaproteobacteria bacterium]|nr:NUDIX hydrolase [Betaproteobacteria bacterium]
MLANSAPRFCSQCGSAKVEFRIPHGDDRERHVCADCDYIHYLNPKMVVGTLPVWEERILLCKRAIEPRYGLWTLPAGFMEEGETLEEGACRETREEANARVTIEAPSATPYVTPYVILSLPQISQVYVLFLARLNDLDFSAGSESLEVRLFDEADIPWDQLAFQTIKIALQHYFADRKAASFVPHIGEIRHPPRP